MNLLVQILIQTNVNIFNNHFITVGEEIARQIQYDNGINDEINSVNKCIENSDIIGLNKLDYKYFWKIKF